MLAHEVAHIRRYDYLVNMVQVLAEALLFYHPAVWWTSGRIRRERELCCDDDAVRVCGDALRYARALTALERMRVMMPSLALGGTDGPLAYRIARVMGAVPEDRLPSKLPGLAGLCLSLLLGVGYLSMNLNRVRAQAPTDAQGVHVDLGSAAVIHRAAVQYPAAAADRQRQGNGERGGSSGWKRERQRCACLERAGGIAEAGAAICSGLAFYSGCGGLDAGDQCGVLSFAGQDFDCCFPREATGCGGI